MAHSQVKIIDHGYRRLLSAAERKHKLKIGVFGAQAAASHGYLTNGELMAVHENGTEHIPARRPIGGYVEEKADLILRDLELVAQGVLLQKITPKLGLTQLGLRHVGLMKQRISDGLSPPNTPETIRRKRSSTPLIQTGQLRNSIASQVVL